MQEMLTEKELAKAAKVSVQTLRNWRAEKKIFAYVKIGRAVRYPLSETEKILQSRTIEAVEE
jgi:predicted site-specific integrase-resolvase